MDTSSTVAFLRGKKTYIAIGAGLLIVAAHFLGYIDDSAEQALLALSGLGSVAGLRDAIKQAQK